MVCLQKIDLIQFRLADLGRNAKRVGLLCTLKWHFIKENLVRLTIAYSVYCSVKNQTLR